jgi:HSP20 family protein
MTLWLDYRLANGGSLFDSVNGLFNGLASQRERTSPPVDVVEDHDGYRFSVELPGLKSESLEVKVEDETLVINAERNSPIWPKDAQVHRAERRYGHIHRTFTLPSDAGRDAIKAAYKDGILDVTIGKRPEAKAVQVEIAYNS